MQTASATVSVQVIEESSGGLSFGIFVHNAYLVWENEESEMNQIHVANLRAALNPFIANRGEGMFIQRTENGFLIGEGSGFSEVVRYVVSIDPVLYERRFFVLEGSNLKCKNIPDVHSFLKLFLF